MFAYEQKIPLSHIIATDSGFYAHTAMQMYLRKEDSKMHVRSHTKRLLSVNRIADDAAYIIIGRAGDAVAAQDNLPEGVTIKYTPDN